MIVQHNTYPSLFPLQRIAYHFYGKAETKKNPVCFEDKANGRSKAE
jgi:hypothetical protein